MAPFTNALPGNGWRVFRCYPLNEVLDVAAELEPAGLRSLDALPLATAVSPGDDVGAFFTYDRLGGAAEENGLTVARPV